MKYFGAKRAMALSLRDVDAYRAWRESGQREIGRTVKPATLNREVGLLRHLVNHAVAYGDLRQNPISRVKMLREDNIRQVVVSEEEFKRLLDVAEPQLKPILLVAYDTGLRKETILGLRWSYYSRKEGTLRLPSQGETTKRRPPEILLSARVREALDKLPISTSGFMFVNPSMNKPWNHLQKVWNRARTAAGLPHVWFHDLRRSFITNARRRDVPESVVMKMSGHRTREVFDRYNIVNDEDLREATRRIEEGQRRELADTKGDDAEAKGTE